MKFLFSLTNFFIGCCLASHAAVISDRFEKEDFIFKRSKCDYCGYELSLLDEIPIISYLLLKGKCRYCHSPIPIKLLIIEIIGGLAYINISFNQKSGIADAILIFSLLLVAICDYEEMEFNLAMLVPAIYLALITEINRFPSYRIADYIEFVPILILLTYYVLNKKLGSGDLFIYLILAFYFKPQFANLTFLSASIFLIIHFLLEYKDNFKEKEVAFIPYIFIGLTLQLLIH